MTKLRLINNVSNLRVQRTISAYQPGVGRKDFTSNATTFGELKQDLEQYGYNLNDVKVSEGHTMITLENDSAMLPTNINTRGTITNDLIIIISPKERPKSGSVETNVDLEFMNRNELLNTVSNIFHSGDIDAKVFFRGFPNKSSEELIRMVKEWNSMEEDTCDCPVPNDMVLEDSVEDLADKVIKIIIDKLSSPVVDSEAYNTALNHIIYGIGLMQNNVLPATKNLPSDMEILEKLEQINYGG